MKICTLAPCAESAEWSAWNQLATVFAYDRHLRLGFIKHSPETVALQIGIGLATSEIAVFACLLADQLVVTPELFCLGDLRIAARHNSREKFRFAFSPQAHNLWIKEIEEALSALRQL